MQKRVLNILIYGNNSVEKQIFNYCILGGNVHKNIFSKCFPMHEEPGSLVQYVHVFILSRFQTPGKLKKNYAYTLHALNI